MLLRLLLLSLFVAKIDANVDTNGPAKHVSMRAGCLSYCLDILGFLVLCLVPGKLLTESDEDTN